MNHTLIRTGLLIALLFVILLYLFSCRQGESGPDNDDPAGDNYTGLQSITVTPVPGFTIEGGIPNAFFDPGDGKIHLIYSCSVGLVEALSVNGITFESVGVSSTRLDTLLTSMNMFAVDVLLRVTPAGIRRYFVRGLRPPEMGAESYIYTADERPDASLRFNGVAYIGGPNDSGIVGVPDIVPTINGLWRMFYVAVGANPGNSRTATSSNGGLSWTFESDNPFGDRFTAVDASTNNVDPAPLALADGRYIALTMREKLLYGFWSEDGLNFEERDDFVLSVIAFPDAPEGSDGLFDPTLVQMPNGKIFMYVTAGGNPGNDAIVAAELTLEWH